MISPVKCLLTSALLATCANAHGWLTKPAAVYDTQMDKSQYIGTIESTTSGFKGTFTGAPADNVAAFTKAFESSKYKSLKAVIDDKAKIIVPGATLTCGIADPKATPQPLPAKVEWYHSESEGFTATHEGPCEVWCDKERVFHDDNCAAHYTAAPAELPYEKSKCTGASFLTMYWVAMHGPSWQVYVNCAPLSGGSGGGATTESSGSSATTTDASAAEAPAAQTPPSEESPSAPTTDSSSADTPSVTPAPAPEGSQSVTPAPASEDSTSVTPAPASGDSPPATPAPDSGDLPSVTPVPASGDSPSTSNCKVRKRK